MVDLPFDNTYVRLPARFFERRTPLTPSSPELIRLNRPLLAELGLPADAKWSNEPASVFSGQALPAGAEPLAQAYAGHQFGQFVPQLGDGRALLLGEVVDRSGVRRDIQLKGSGRTVFSRGGDGLAPLGPVLREYVVSEAMHALGVPTTRALAAVKTGDTVLRDTVLPGAVLTRVASSHLRVGTFQYFAVRQDREALATLLDYTLRRHYPDRADSPDPAMALLDAVSDRQAALVARWMSLGFIHGVMNTDNTALSGETIDYGPCAFMEGYNPGQVFSSIDQGGRYAYRNQPGIMQWNLARLAEALLARQPEPEAELEQARAIISAWPERYEQYRLDCLRPKMGLQTAEAEDAVLADRWLELMADARADFTLAFRRLADFLTDESALDELFESRSPLLDWRRDWLARLDREGTTTEQAAACIRATNPAIIPRNHLVEEAIRAAEDRDDFQPFHDLVEAVTDPCRSDPVRARYEAPAAPQERVFQTFCGT